MAQLEAPTTWKNITDSFIGTNATPPVLDQCRACAGWVGWQYARNLAYIAEKLTGRKYGDTLQNTPHSHGELELQPSLSVSYRDGVCVPRTVALNHYSSGSQDYRTIANVDSSFQLIAKMRGLVGGFQNVATEIRWSTVVPNNQKISWKVLSFDALDSQNQTAGNEDHTMDESAIVSPGTEHLTVANHTVNGIVDAAGSATKLMPIDKNTTPPDYDDAFSWREFWIYAQNEGGGTVHMQLYWIHIFEVLSGDL